MTIFRREFKAIQLLILVLSIQPDRILVLSVRPGAIWSHPTFINGEELGTLDGGRQKTPD